MYYKHNLDYEYPERSDEHMLKVNYKKKISFDENYKYLDKSLGAKIKRSFFWCCMNFLVFPVNRIRYGLKIHGKKNIRKNKKLLKNGAITISNHVFKWDFICVLMAIRPHLLRFPAWKDNFEGSEGGLVKWAGGIPIPTESIDGMKKFKSAMDEVLSSKKWMHFFPEGSMWYFYPDIRPLKKMVFKYAYKFDKPIVPISMSFRPRKGIFKLFGKSPCVDLHIGEPIVPDREIPAYLAIDNMHKEAYHVMQVMNGITPDMENYRVDQDINGYQKTM